jgi:hypothetical protein
MATGDGGLEEAPVLEELAHDPYAPIGLRV